MGSTTEGTLFNIRYVGQSGIRIISAEDLAKRGIGMSKDMVWSPQNQYQILVQGLSDKMAELLRAEGTFVVTEVDKAGKKKSDIILGRSLDDTGGMVVDKTTGQVSRKK